MRLLSCINFILLLTVLSTGQVYAQRVTDTPDELKGVNVDEKLGSSIPLDLQFKNEKGKAVKLADYFKSGKPVVLTMAYYECPMLCTMVLNAVRDSLRKLAWTAGQEFTLLTVSIDPEEGSELATQKRAAYEEGFYANQRKANWNFLVGSAAASKQLADAIGFNYYYNEKIGEWAHPAVAFLLSDQGKVTRYLYGLNFKQQDMRLALVEASKGKIGSTIDKVLLYCYQYDPDARGYVLVARNVMKLGGGFTVFFLATFLGILWRRERKSTKRSEL